LAAGGPTFWHWLILSGLLLLVEALAPGASFLWLSVGAGLTGLLLAVLPGLGWQLQVLHFALWSVASVSLWLWWRARSPAGRAGGGDSTLNRRALHYVGSEAVLVAAIAAGHGRVRVGDGTWLADGPELPAGTRVRIAGARGAVLLVEPVEAAVADHHHHAPGGTHPRVTPPGSPPPAG
jgi:membrane protein implicated in regulation of membrane protease activity